MRVMKRMMMTKKIISMRKMERMKKSRKCRLYMIYSSVDHHKESLK
jgi:hypothetical protein